MQRTTKQKVYVRACNHACFHSLTLFCHLFLNSENRDGCQYVYGPIEGSQDFKTISREVMRSTDILCPTFHEGTRIGTPTWHP